MTRTQVAIVGAGPAGLVLAHLLAANGIESVVLESRERDYVERRIRAGVLEQGTVNLLHQLGLDARLQREGMVHRGIELRFEGQSHRIPLSDLTGGRAITVYGQQEVVKDLIAARLEAGGQILFGAEAIGIDAVTSTRPVVRFRHEGRIESLEADFVAGCDGSHGVCRSAIPAEVLQLFHKDYPVAWLGVLAAVAPSTDELIYAYHERGFALHSMRTPQLSRLYVQCHPDDSLDNWSDDRIWSELHQRFAMDGWSLAEGPLVDRSITPMRSVIVEPMQHGRLFLAGDAAHIVPATGAKGLNLAVSDVQVLADALAEWYRSGRTERLESYSSTCLRRVWRVEHFSWWMTSMLHRFDDEGPFEHRLHLSQLRYVCSSAAAATSLAENYVGLEQL
ncbi:MAG TPA: 4-hydroxybenzoate 3-monooxygenase [Nitrolancea sp.]